MSKTIKLGNDGYGNKNIKVTKNSSYLLISVSDPHDHGRATTIYIPATDIQTLANFLSQ